MKSNRQSPVSHLVKPLWKLTKIFKNMSLPSPKEKGILDARIKLIDLLDDPSIKQVMMTAEIQNYKSKLRQKSLVEDIVFDLDITEDAIMLLLKKRNMKIENMTSESINFPLSQQAPLEDLMLKKFEKVRRLLASYIQQTDSNTDNTSGLASLLKLEEYERQAENILRKGKYLSWETEKEVSVSRTKLFQSCTNLISFEKEIKNYDSYHIKSIRSDIQIICVYLIEKITMVDEPGSIKIYQITYFYTSKAGERKARLNLFINEKPIEFEGDRATVLKIILDHPLNKTGKEQFDFEKAERIPERRILKASATQPNYTVFRDMVEDINIRIWNELPEFGITEFIERDISVLNLNPACRSFVNNI